MKAIMKYQASDDCEFNTEKQCAEYELLIVNIANIMSALPSRPIDSSFSNGDMGYIQHDKTTLRLVQVELLELMKEHIDHDWIQQTIDDETVHPSYVGRLLSDYGISPLDKAWHRFHCIDNLSREWGQPYYAMNPDKAKQTQINT